MATISALPAGRPATVATSLGDQPLDAALLPWLARLRRAQQLLGDLNDLQVLEGAIADQLGAGLASDLPVLHGLLQQRIQILWCDWSPLAAQLGTAAARRRLLRDLTAEPPPTNQHHNLDLPLNNS